MASKTRLRDFQAYLAERLTSAAQGARAASWLGLEVGESRWLVDLSDSGEIIQAPEVTSVPLTRPWFAGVANIRGNLYAVTDFSRFCGGVSTPVTPQTRLLLIGVRHGSNAALLVSRMLGLKNPAEFEPVSQAADAPAWQAAVLQDGQGKHWKKLAVRELLADPDFMNIEG